MAEAQDAQIIRKSQVRDGSRVRGFHGRGSKSGNNISLSHYMQRLREKQYPACIDLRDINNHDFDHMDAF